MLYYACVPLHPIGAEDLIGVWCQAKRAQDWKYTGGRMFTRALSCVVALTVLFATVFYAQAPAGLKPAASGLQQVAQAQDAGGDDPLGRTTPRGTVFGFIRAANRGDYDLAARYLDTRQHGDLARELARQLQTILDRETSIDLNKVSRQPEGNHANAGMSSRYLVGVANTSSSNVEILLDRIQRGDEPPIWLFSEATLQYVPNAYEDLSETSGIERYLPGWLKVTIFSQPIWRLMVFLIAVLLVLFLGFSFVRVLNSLLAIVESRVWGEVSVTRTKGLAASLCLTLFGILFVLSGGFSDTLLHRTFWRNLGRVLIILGVMWLFMRIFGLLTEFAVAQLKRVQSFDKIALASLAGRLSQVGALTIGILVVLHLAGVNLTAALTGLGIGGLAVAFAAQKTLENLFGGIMIISDRPVRVGDLCKAGDVIGHVVDIGLRSTRIRTLDRSIVTIPNGQLAIVNLENQTLRDKFWFHPTIALSQQTTSKQMESVLRNIRKMLDNHAKVESKTLRARFISISSASLDVEVFAYILAADSNEFLSIQEQLLIAIMAIVESADAAFAVPIQINRLVRSAAPPQEPLLEHENLKGRQSHT
jgi:MscS family membrane protein